MTKMCEFGRVLFIFSLLGAGVNALYRVSLLSQEDRSDICLSNDVTVETLYHYWVLTNNKEDSLLCSVGNTETKSMTSKKELMEVIRAVQESTSKLWFTCRPIDGPEKEMSLSFDGLANTDSGSLIVSCKDGTSIRPVFINTDSRELLERKIQESELKISQNEEIKKRMLGDISSIKKELEETLRGQDSLRASEIAAIKELETLREKLSKAESVKESDLAEISKKMADQKGMIESLEAEISRLKKTRGDLRVVAQKEKEKAIHDHELVLSDLERSAREKQLLAEQKAELQEMLKRAEENLKQHKDRADKISQREQQLHDKIDELNLKIKRAESERAESGKNNKDRDHNGESAKATRSGSKGLGSSLLTTVAPIITSVLLLASTVSSEENPWEHSFNRPGVKKNYKLETSEDASCSAIDYGSKCPGFLHLLNTTQYPLFNAHVHKFSFLEAVEDSIITKETSGVCTLNNGAGVQKCNEYKALIKSYCPHGFKSAHYLDGQGKLRGVSCPDQHELSEDCNFCVKITGSTVKKSTVALQDGFCQKSTEQLKGREPASKVYCSVGRKSFKSCSRVQSQHESVAFVIFNNGPKIYLDKLIMKNDEILNDSAFLCYDYKGQLAGTDTNAADERGKKSIKITECKSVDPSKSRICTGDSIFCTRHSCTNEYPNAYCMVAPGSGPVRVFINGAWQTPKCIGYEVVKVSREVKPIIQTVDQPCQDCIVDCLNEGIHIKTTGRFIGTATACSHGYCTSHMQDPSPDAVVPYPGGSHTTGGEISIHLSNSKQEPGLSLKVYCPAHDGCSIIDCVFCRENFLNFHCHTILSSLFLAFLISLITYSVVMTVWKVMKTLKVIPSYVKSPLDWIVKFVSWIIKKIASSLAQRFRRLNENINNDVEIGEMAPLGRRELRPIPRNIIRTTFVLGLIAMASACSQNEIASSKITKCRMDGSKTICKYTGIINLKAGMIGSESCVILKGNVEGQQNMIRIKTLSSESVCREGNSFWTGQFSPVCHSSRRCHLVAECKGDACQSWNSTVVSKEFKSIVEHDVMSENRCFEQCGGIGCTCFNVYPSCLFVHMKLKPVRKEAVRVFNCVDWIHKINFEVSSPDGTKEKVSISSMESKFFNWGSLSLSLDADIVTESSGLTFLKSSSGGFALADEALPAQPRKGFLGEIRCSSEAAVASAHKSCIRAPDLIHYSPRMDAADCTTSLVDPFAAFLRGSLPQTRHGRTYTSSIDKQTVQALTNSMVQASFVLNLDDYEVEFQESSSSCDVAFVNLTGCYSCNSGALACFSLYSSGGAEVIISSKSSDKMFGFSAESTKKEKCQIQHYNEPIIDEMMDYTCGGVSRTIRVKGHLVAQSMKTDLVSTGSSVIVNPVKSDFSITGLLYGFSKWMGSPLKALGTAAIYIVIGFAILLSLIYGIRITLSKALSLAFKKKK
ncbi:polyprotein [Bujaru virus]|uniref:Envelopment polyprotein n=1 Tax=Bujaru virus TaxID=904679 RepID=A0A1S5SHT4_9VIRU|nr:polyprotein [Bujaru virus]API68881.1 polyprotein [Bujaru virus]QLA46867.1 polyprotein [Bujaru virus]